MVQRLSGRPSDNPARVQQGPLGGQWPTHLHMIFKCTKTRTYKLCAHIRSIMRSDTHTQLQTHTWMIIPRPLGASLKLFSRDLAKSEMSIGGSENERWRKSLKFTRMLPGENSHPLCVSSVPESQSFLQEHKDPDCSNILSGKLICHRSLYSCFFGRKVI